jgi:hypothetical protein
MHASQQQQQSAQLRAETAVLWSMASAFAAKTAKCHSQPPRRCCKLFALWSHLAALGEQKHCPRFIGDTSPVNTGGCATKPLPERVSQQCTIQQRHVTIVSRVQDPLVTSLTTRSRSAERHETATNQHCFGLGSALSNTKQDQQSWAYGKEVHGTCAITSALLKTI